MMESTNLTNTTDGDIQDEFDYIPLGNRYYKLNDKVLLRVNIDFVLKKGEEGANLNMQDIESADDIDLSWLNSPKPTVLPKGPISPTSLAS